MIIKRKNIISLEKEIFLKYENKGHKYRVYKVKEKKIKDIVKIVFLNLIKMLAYKNKIIKHF